MSDVLPEHTSDEDDRGWGDDLRPLDDDPDRRLLEDVPPHHVERD